MTVHHVRVRRSFWFVLWLGLALLPLVLSLGVRDARAETEAEEARAFHEKAKAAFALSHYSQAAEFFEKAFELKPDSALLYNAAQSHRLAGNKERALTLYQNYLRVYPRDERHAQIDQRIDELKKAMEKDRREAPASPPSTWPPGTRPPANLAPASGPVVEPLRPAPPAVTARPVEPAPAPAPLPAAVPPPPPPIASASSPTLLTQTGAPPAEGPSLTQKPWFWVVVGGGVAVAATAVLFLTLSKTKDPSASFGQARGN